MHRINNRNSLRNRNKIRIVGYVEYALVIALFAASGNPTLFSSLGGRTYVALTFFALSLLIFLARKRSLTRNSTVILYLFGVLAIIHYFEFGSQTIFSSAANILTITSAMLLSSAVRSFWTKFVRTAAVLAWISLAFHIPTVLGAPLSSLFGALGLPSGSPDRVSAAVHHFIVYAPQRNAGFFWEPGAFAGYLAVALLVCTFRVPKIQTSAFEVVGLAFALLSTMSTTGYAALSVVAFLHIYQSPKMRRLDAKFLLLPVLALPLFVIAYWAYMQFPFLGDKALHQLSVALERERGWQLTRFGNFFSDIDLLKERPLFGWSFANSLRTAYIDQEILRAQGNGFSGFLVSTGLLAFSATFVFMFFQALKLYRRTTEAILAILAISVALTGQHFLNFPVFWLLIVGPTSAGRYFSKRSRIPSSLNRTKPQYNLGPQPTQR